MVIQNPDQSSSDALVVGYASTAEEMERAMARASAGLEGGDEGEAGGTCCSMPVQYLVRCSEGARERVVTVEVRWLDCVM